MGILPHFAHEGVEYPGKTGNTVDGEEGLAWKRKNVSAEAA